MKLRKALIIIPLFFHTCAPWDYASARGLNTRYGVSAPRGSVALKGTALRMPPAFRPLPIGSMRGTNKYLNQFLVGRQHGARMESLRNPPGSSYALPTIPALSSGPHLPR